MGISEKEKEIKETLDELQNDFEEVKESASENDPNTLNQLEYFLGKHQKPLIGIGVAIVGIYIWLNVSIPEKFWVIATMFVFGCGVASFFASDLAKKFVPDNRKPFKVDNPYDPSDFQLYKVPDQRVSDVEVYEGELHQIDTIQGMGYECTKFETVQGEKGKEHVLAKGTILGQLPGSVIKTHINKLSHIEENLYPLAQYGHMWKRNEPHIKHQMYSQALNEVVQGFEKHTIHNHDEMNVTFNEEVENRAFGQRTDEEGKTMKYEEGELQDIKEQIEQGEM